MTHRPRLLIALLLALPLAPLVACGEEEPTAIDKAEAGLKTMKEGQQQVETAIEGMTQEYEEKKKTLDEFDTRISEAKADLLAAQTRRLVVLRSTLDALGKRVATLPAGEEAELRVALADLNTRADAFEQRLAAFAGSTGEATIKAGRELEEASAELRRASDAVAERVAAERIDEPTP